MSESQKIRVGVIGAGHLGSLHAKMYADIPTAFFAGIFDSDRSRCETIAKTYGVVPYESIQHLLNEVDAVSIATPTSTHHAVALEALAAGKHLLIEKPITTTAAQADELIALAEKKGCIIQVGHIERFNPAILSLEAYTLAPLFVESHRLAQFNPRGTDVAVVLDLMIHDIDIILSLVNSPVTKIDANGVSVVSDSVDIANARLQFENGCVANVTASRISQNKMRKMRMFQHNAYISIDFLQGHSEVFRLVDADDPSIKPTMMLGQIGEGSKKRSIVYEQPEMKDVNALKYELTSFIDAIKNKRTPIVDAVAGRRALQVAGEIMEKIMKQNIIAAG